MADALFDYRSSYDLWLVDLAAIFGFGNIQPRLVDSQRIGMHWCLGYQTVGQGKANDTADEAGTAKQEEIPVEAGGFLERVLAGLRRKRGNVLLQDVRLGWIQSEEVETYVIIVEEQHHQETKRQCHKHPLDIEVPEVNHPIAILGGLEGSYDRDAV